MCIDGRFGSVVCVLLVAVVSFFMMLRSGSFCVGDVWWLGGLPYRTAGSLSSEAGIPSPLVTGKRSLTGGSGANSLPGSIPVKRARSSAANLRPRGTQPGASPGNTPTGNCICRCDPVCVAVAEVSGRDGVAVRDGCVTVVVEGVVIRRA